MNRIRWLETSQTSNAFFSKTWKSRIAESGSRVLNLAFSPSSTSIYQAFDPWANWIFRGYIILRFYPTREIRKNLMHGKNIFYSTLQKFWPSISKTGSYTRFLCKSLASCYIMTWLLGMMTYCLQRQIHNPRFKSCRYKLVVLTYKVPSTSILDYLHRRSPQNYRTCLWPISALLHHPCFPVFSDSLPIFKSRLKPVFFWSLIRPVASTSQVTTTQRCRN